LTDRNDSDASFEALVRPELQRLYRLAYRLSGAANDAEDLVQNVLIKAYERRRELSSIDGLGAWLARVMYNAFVDDLRRHKRRRFTSCRSMMRWTSRTMRLHWLLQGYSLASCKSATPSELRLQRRLRSSVSSTAQSF